MVSLMVWDTARSARDWKRVLGQSVEIRCAPEVERDRARDGAEADKDTPGEVDLVVRRRAVDDVALEGHDRDESDEGGEELAVALGREDAGHHAAADPGSSKLGGDDGRERVVAADTDAHDESIESKSGRQFWRVESRARERQDEAGVPPEDEDADDRDGRAVTRKSLGEGGDDDDHELNLKGGEAS
jgi:hypothetical protein